MKVLWISPTPACYKLKEDVGSGGWITSLQKQIEKDNLIELGIIFLHPTDMESVRVGNTTYFPLKAQFSRFSRILNLFSEKINEKYITQILNIVSSYNPDVIHIWGCEHFYIEITKYLKKPFVVHIQGIMGSVVNSEYPPGISFFSLMRIGIFEILKNYLNHRQNKKRAVLEESCIKYVTNWIGRTEWDRNVILYRNPNSRYFHCDEIMRSVFYEGQWKYSEKNKFVIHTTCSNSFYKGIDIIFKTAEVLCEQNIPFIWNICGVDEKSTTVKYSKSRWGTSALKDFLKFHGRVSPLKMKGMLLNSNVYVHTSYIESGCNAISEAQLLGVPIIAQYVGGLPTTLKNDSGILVQANDPWMLASKILKMKNKAIALEYSERGRNEALRRNDPKKIVSDLIEIYKTII